MTRRTGWSPREPLSAGVWVQLGAANVDVVSQGGFDWIGIDGQHGLFDERAIFEALHAVPSEKSDVIVRIPENSDAWIGRVLDAGARGVIIPMVETAAEAERAARAARFPPVGRRSYGPVRLPWARPVLTSSREDVEYMDSFVAVGVMVESQLGLDNVEAIAATPGVDMIFVGPWDLSIALGTTVDEFIRLGEDSALARIVDACRRHDVIPGAYAGTDQFTDFLVGLGFQVLATASDTGLLASARPPGQRRESGGSGPY